MAMFDDNTTAAKPVQGHPNGSLGQDQEIKLAKIGTPISIHIDSLAQDIEIKSVSLAMLDLIHQHIVGRYQEAKLKESKTQKGLDALNQQFDVKQKALTNLQKKGLAGEKPEKQMGIDAEKKITIDSIALVREMGKIFKSISEKQHIIVMEQVLDDADAYVPVLQLLWLNNKNPKWWENSDGWPDKALLENALPEKVARFGLTSEEVRAVFDAFWQKNDAGSLRQVFFRLAGLQSAQVNSSGEN